MSLMNDKYCFFFFKYLRPINLLSYLYYCLFCHLFSNRFWPKNVFMFIYLCIYVTAYNTYVYHSSDAFICFLKDMKIITIRTDILFCAIYNNKKYTARFMFVYIFNIKFM